MACPDSPDMKSGHAIDTPNLSQKVGNVCPDFPDRLLTLKICRKKWDMRVRILRTGHSHSKFVAKSGKCVSEFSGQAIRTQNLSQKVGRGCPDSPDRLLTLKICRKKWDMGVRILR